MKVGDTVSWKWGSGTGQGKVEKRYERRVTRKIAGSGITRNGSQENPALFIRQKDGAAVLKLASEVGRD